MFTKWKDRRLQDNLDKLCEQQALVKMAKG